MRIFMRRKRENTTKFTRLTLFLIRQSPELSLSAISAASFLMIFFNSVSSSVVYLLWLGADFRNRKNKVGRE